MKTEILYTVNMKKILFILLCFLPLSLNAQNFLFGKPITTTLNSADKLVLFQSGSSKTFTIATLSDYVSDSLDLLRTELGTNWRNDIADTATVLRGEIADVATADTAWSRTATNITRLKYITDSVGIGNIAPTEKLHVTGKIRAIAALLNNGYDNTLLGGGAGAALTSSGTDNIYIGVNAGTLSTSADKSIVIGNYAGDGFTAGGSYNVLIGHQAGTAATSIVGSVLLGYQAGAAIITSTGSTIIGYLAGSTTTDGLQLTAIGSESFAATTGTGNTGLGFLVGNDITSGAQNTFIGASAGSTVTGALDGNTFVGYNAGLDADANYSTAIGATAGYQNDQDGSTTIGFAAGISATGSAGLTAMGFSAGYSITTSDYHSIFGYEAGDAITTGSAGSSLFGYQAGTDMTTAEGASLFGYLAGTNITTGNHHTIFGYEAGKTFTTASASSIFGYQAGIAATDAAGLTLMGYRAGYSNTTGDYNTFIGQQTGRNVTTGSNNTYLGWQAGYDNNVTGCVGIGYQAGYNNASDSILSIDNGSTATPLIWGDFAADSVVINGDETVTGVLTVTGNMSGCTQVTLDTDPTIVLTAGDCKNKARINNDADAIDYTLPGAAAGLVVIFYDIAGGVMTIDPVDGTDTIYLNGVSVGAGDAIDSPGAAGDFICLMAIDATRWVTVGQSGTWVDGGAD